MRLGVDTIDLYQIHWLNRKGCRRSGGTQGRTEDPPHRSIDFNAKEMQRALNAPDSDRCDTTFGHRHDRFHLAEVKRHPLCDGLG
jgi:aryl-alcohol dehydrogenase-like predicted oxidoreductase